MDVTYDNVQQLLCSDGFSDLVPEGVVLSQPVISKKESLIIDNFFVMTKVREGYHLIYKFGLNYNLKKLEYCERYPSQTKIAKVQPIEGLSLKDFQEYKKSYAYVRKMYAGLDQVNTDVLKNYLKFLIQLVSQELVVFYNDLSPDFFSWIKHFTL